MKWSVKTAPAPDMAETAVADIASDEIVEVDAPQSDFDEDPEVQKELELKISIHRALLDEINLAALDKMPREKVREEVAEIIGDLITERREALNRSEREVHIVGASSTAIAWPVRVVNPRHPIRSAQRRTRRDRTVRDRRSPRPPR